MPNRSPPAPQVRVVCAALLTSLLVVYFLSGHNPGDINKKPRRLSLYTITAMNDPIRWLHLSDFHVGKDNYAQRRLFDKIVDHVKNKAREGAAPDLVFITGDIAQKGSKAEYQLFRNEFIKPLEDALGGADWSGKVFVVPGNHDVDRTKNAALDRSKPIASGGRFFDPTKGGKSEREIVFPRFKFYRQLAPGDVSANWVSDPAGAYAETVTIRGRSIGVVGINTAWLSMGDDDKEKLTPGVHLVESALAKVKECAVRIVLGHHPLHWMVEGEAIRLRAMFGYHQVIYLHGHLHRAEGRREDGAGEQFLVFQAGAAFQARDGDKPFLPNGLLWGEIHWDEGQVRVCPRFWNPVNYDWPTENGRFPERLRVPNSDWWSYPLPGRSEAAAPGLGWEAPEGWELIEQSTLPAQRREISREEAERFFDGAEPDWPVALCPKFPRRAVVERLAQLLTGYRGQERPFVALLLGPGGEGKSMALRQTVVGVLEREPATRVLWHSDVSRPLSEAQLLALPKGRQPWLVATDAADLIARPLHRAVAALARAGRADVRLLLAVRESDWRAVGGTGLDWRQYATFHQESLSGVSEADALLIAQAWQNFGAAGSDPAALDTIAQGLLNAAKAEVGEGALLGGVLAIRRGEGLRAHVRALLDRLAEIQLPSGGNLYSAFAYIAAMHAKGFQFLSRPVLAEVLGCQLGQLQREVLFTLGREAAAGGGTMLLTRHRRIAEAAVEVMADDLGDYVDGYYVTLVSAAKQARAQGAFIPELHRWDYDLAAHFMEREHRPDLAIRIASALLEQDPDNSRLAVNLAKLYLRADDPAAGARALSEFRGEVGANRIFWYEWGVCAGNNGNPALNAWLAGWSLADQAGVAPPDNNDASVGLGGLGVAFGALFERYGERAFNEARAAVARLGLGLRLDSKSRGYLIGHLEEAESTGASAMEPVDALECLKSGLLRAWEVCGDREALADRIPVPDQMRFEGLARLCCPDQ